MSWIDVDNEHIKMKCDWCGLVVWWIDGDRKHGEFDGWSDIDTHIWHDNHATQPFPLKHLCPDCYLKKLTPSVDPTQCQAPLPPTDSPNTTAPTEREAVKKETPEEQAEREANEQGIYKSLFDPENPNMDPEHPDDCDCRMCWVYLRTVEIEKREAVKEPVLEPKEQSGVEITCGTCYHYAPYPKPCRSCGDGSNWKKVPSKSDIQPEKSPSPSSLWFKFSLL